MTTGPDGFTRLAGDAAYDRLHGVDGHVQATTIPRMAKPSMEVNISFRVARSLRDAAREKAEERQENVSDVLREALERYVRLAVCPEPECERLRSALAAVRSIADEPGGAFTAGASQLKRELRVILSRAGR